MNIIHTWRNSRYSENRYLVNAKEKIINCKRYGSLFVESQFLGGWGREIIAQSQKNFMSFYLKRSARNKNKRNHMSNL